MTQGIRSIGSLFAPSPNIQPRIKKGENALSAPTSPSHQLPMIDKSKVDPKILEAAEGMEAMFIDYMMKVMRQTVPKNDLDLESPATAIYRSMQDSEYAQKAAHHQGPGGIGLADQIIDYVEASGYHQPRVPEGRVTNSKGSPEASVRTADTKGPTKEKL